MRHLKTLRYFDQVARSGSIRKAAEDLNVTASALDRRLMDIEEELGVQLFERLPRGMRLTAAGELFARYVRNQIAEAERVRSQIEELRGLQRGVVRIAASQALAHGFLPEVIHAFRASYPLISFEVTISDHERAMKALAMFDVDLVLVFRPPPLPNFQALLTIGQRVLALMGENHPLAAKKQLRLSDCLQYPLALPEKSIGGRQLLEEVAARAGTALKPAIQSNSFEFLRRTLGDDRTLSFQIEIGALPDYLSGSGVVSRPIDARDLPASDLVLGQLRERNLPVPAAGFCERLKASMSRLREPAPAALA